MMQFQVIQDKAVVLDTVSSHAAKAAAWTRAALLTPCKKVHMWKQVCWHNMLGYSTIVPTGVEQELA